MWMSVIQQLRELYGHSRHAGRPATQPSNLTKPAMYRLSHGYGWALYFRSHGLQLSALARLTTRMLTSGSSIT